MKQKISVSEIQAGSRYSSAIWGKKDNLLLPALHSVHSIYLEEWASEGEFVFTEGTIVEDIDNDIYKRELPGYIDIETRMLLQTYYENIDILKELYQNVTEITLSQLQQITASWVSYAIKKNNLSSLLRVSRYALFPLNDYFYIHNIDTMLISIGIYKQYYKSSNVSELNKIATGALLSNIGMLLLPRGLVEASERMTNEQKQDIQKHTLLGYSFLISRLDFPADIALPALEHHERPDGSGYPNKLKGEQLHPNSIIISLADVFAAQIHHRSFKESREPVEILKDFIQTVMPIFPMSYGDYISAFISFVTIYPPTSILELDTNEVVIVTKTYPEHPTRPKVLVLLDSEKTEATTVTEIELSDEDNLHINIIGSYTKISINSISKG